jgi:hypothetical protein
MQVGDVTTSVEVSSAAELVKKDDVQLGQVITTKSITALPLNGRNFIQLAQLSPGVIQIGTAISPVTDWTSRTDQSIVVAGLRENDSSYLLDGIETRSPRWGSAGFRPSVDAILEFNVQRNAFTADQGWGTTVVNTLLRSGTNEFHGTLYEFLRNGKLDARNFFDGTTKPPFKQNQFGATMGGPIVHNKLFFFAAYEGFRQRLTNTLQGNFPNATQFGGAFSKTIIDPRSGTAFPNNTIPADRIDAIAKNVIPYFPTPNRPTDPSLNYVRAAALRSDADQVHGKLDYNIGDADRMFARYSWDDEPLLSPSLVAGFGLNRPLGDQNVALSETHTFGASAVNELHIGYNRNRDFSTPERAYGPDLAAQIGLKNTSKTPANFTLPGFNISGYSGVGQGFAQTQETIDQIYQLNESFQISKGKHTVRTGIDIRYNRLNITNDFPSAPFFNFDGSYTGDATADFLLGLFQSTQAFNGSSAADFRRTNFAPFVEDNWKINPKLTLSFGLRYEYEAPYSEAHNKLNYLNFQTLQFVHVNGPVIRPDRNNFAPRFGFAYAPFSKTVVRGGFGVFYDLVSANETQFFGVLNPPNSQILALTNTLPKPTYQLQDMYPPFQFAPSTAPNTVDPNNRTPYLYQYNFNVQQDIRGFLLETAYVGSTGHKLNRRFNSNLAYPNPALPIAVRRPYKGFDDILTSLNNGWSNYNGLNVSLQKRYSKGLLLLAAYTFGKALDIGGPDEYVHHDLTGTLKELRGPASLDTKHRFVTSLVYELPVGRGKALLSNTGSLANGLLGGWQVNTIATFSSGQPRTPAPGVDWANIGGRRLQPGNRTGPGNDSDLRSNIRNNPVLFPYFRVQDFSLPPRGYVGNGGRGTIIGPGVNNWDFGLIKHTPIQERIDTEFRAEFFNLFNHAQFAGIDTNLNDASFGRITSARAPRDIQFGIKIIF